MCKRFNVTDDSILADFMKSLNLPAVALPTRYNLAPTDQIPVIHNWEGKRIISDMRWWLVPNWVKESSTKYPMFNARYESLNTSLAYKGSYRHKRCVIPAHSFVDWLHQEEEKIPYLFSAVDQALVFAGIWDYWSDGIEHILSCAIITTKAAPEYERYGTRMPVMLTTETAEQWLDEKNQTDIYQPLFEAKLPYPLQAAKINSAYNQSSNKSAPELLETPTLI